MQRNTDTVPAMLTPGEFVIRKDAAEQIGPEKLQMLNNIDRLSNSALLENARTPVAMQNGGQVQQAQEAQDLQGFPKRMQDYQDPLPIGNNKTYRPGDITPEDVLKMIEREKERKGKEFEPHNQGPSGYEYYGPPNPADLYRLKMLDELGEAPKLKLRRFQEGGEVQGGGFFGLFKDKIGGFLEQQGKNWERAAMMEEETGTRNPFLKTAEEQRALQRQYGLVPGGEITPPAPPQRPNVPMEQVRYALEMLGDESMYSSDTEKAYQESLPGLEKLTQKYDRYLDSVRAREEGELEGDARREELKKAFREKQGELGYKHSESLEKLKKIEHLSNLARDAGRPEQLGVRARGWDPFLGELEEVALVNPGRPTVRPDRESVEMLSDEKISPEFDNEMFKMLHGMEDRYDFSPWESPPPMPEDERGGFLDYLFGGRDNIATSRSLMEDILGLKQKRTGYQEGGEVMHNDELMSVFGEKSQNADGLRALAALIRMQQMQQAEQDATRAMGPDNIIPNNIGTMDAKTLEFLKSMKEPTSSDNFHRMDPETLEFLKRQKEPTGMMGGGYVKKYKQGGPVEPPMTGGEPMMLEEPPMPTGEQAYYETPENQLGLDRYEHMAYMKHGPDSFRFMAPKYKPRQQWSAYDALVDTGLVNPYEVDRDEVNVVTNDQMEELSRTAQMAMRQ